MDRPRKSVAVENTLLADISQLNEAEAFVSELYQKLLGRLQRSCANMPLNEFKKLGVKLKFDDFSQTTLEKTTDGMNQQWFIELLHQIWQRREGRSVRLIGINVHLPEPNAQDEKQIALW
jgi:DNA polymerase-4